MENNQASPAVGGSGEACDETYSISMSFFEFAHGPAWPVCTVGYPVPNYLIIIIFFTSVNDLLGSAVPFASIL